MDDRPTDDGNGRVLTRGRLTVLGTLLVVGVGAVVAARLFDPAALLRTIRGADRRLLAVAVAVYALSWPVRGRRYGDVLAAMERRCGLGFLTAAVFVSQTANLLVPARAGDGVRAYLLNDRRGVPYAAGVASLAVERVFDLVAVAALGGLAAAWLLLDGRTIATAGETGAGAPTLAAGVAGATLVLSAATVAVARLAPRLGAAARTRADGTRLSGVVDAAVRFGAAVRVVAADRRSLGAIGAGSALAWALDVLTATLVLAALTGGPGGAAMSLPAFATACTLAVSVGNLAKVLPLSQGGIGLYEAAFTGLLAGVAPIAAGTALAAAVLDHALKNGVTLVGGGVAAVALGASPFRTSAPTDPVEARGDD
jgi:uncharacterized membrane protein YbhN (UPF0104 family)